MRFPVLAISPSGFTWLFEQSRDTAKMPIGFIGIYERQKAALRFFDADGAIWKLTSIHPKKRLWFWDHLLAATRDADVQLDFERIREGNLEELKGSLVEAIHADDDILMQFRSRDAILKRLAKASTTEDVLSAYRWMRRE